MNYIKDTVYKKIIQNVPICCVDVVIVDYIGSALLVKRKDPPAKNLWWIPGGRVLKGEMLKDAAIRKAKEETGLECIKPKLIYTDETIFDDGPFDIPIHSINNCFILYTKLQYNLNEVNINDSCSDYKWIGFIDNKLHHYVKNCLLAANLKILC